MSPRRADLHCVHTALITRSANDLHLLIAERLRDCSGWEEQLSLLSAPRTEDAESGLAPLAFLRLKDFCHPPRMMCSRASGRPPHKMQALGGVGENLRVADRYREIRRLSAQMLDEAFARLAEERVLPRSQYEPWIHVGREFEGWLIHGLPCHSAFVAALGARFPQRFAGEAAAKDFASIYPFALVTAAVARLTRASQPYEARQPAALEVIQAFIRHLSSESERAAILFVVAGIETASGDARAGQIVVSTPGRFDVHSAIERIIPGAGFASANEDLFLVGLPISLLVSVASRKFADADALHGPFSLAASTATERLDGLVSAVRLATNATLHVLAVARGQPGLFQVYPPRVWPVAYRDFLADVRRPLTLDAPLIRRLYRLQVVWRDATKSERGVVPGLSIAVQRFNRSFGEANWRERLVDLVVALEAALGQEDANAEVLLRLRNRAAALLADVTDDAGRVFDDIGVIYDLRSRVLHGSSQSGEKLLARIEKVPSTAAGPMPGVKAELLIDRSRDIVRRAILARLFLAQGAKPEWPL